MRIIMKVSGESLKDKDNLSDKMLEKILPSIKNLALSNELILVVGGGNFWRGRNNLSINNAISDRIGMLATVMNGLCLNDYLNNSGIKSSLYSAFDIEGIVNKYKYEEVEKDLKNKRVVIFSGGLGVSNFSTDMVAVNKALEFNCDMILMAKNIDGIYDKDPSIKGAKKYSVISHKELFLNQIKDEEIKDGVIDLEAMATLLKCKIPLYLYSSHEILDNIDSLDKGTKVITKDLL